jgi:Holliday junction resolvase RusA-like endonuclease
MAAACQDHHQSNEDGPRSDENPLSGMGHAGGAARGPSAVTFRVEGMAPAPQGSKDWLPNRRMKESCPHVKPWRILVAQSAVAAGVPLLRGPVRLSVVFIFSRPAGHFRKDGSLKPSAPLHHSIRPDLSKLLRSTEDALTSVVYEDDSRIVGCAIEKRYAIGNERPGALVTVIPL